MKTLVLYSLILSLNAHAMDGADAAAAAVASTFSGPSGSDDRPKPTRRPEGLVDTARGLSLKLVEPLGDGSELIPLAELGRELVGVIQKNSKLDPADGLILVASTLSHIEIFEYLPAESQIYDEIAAVRERVTFDDLIRSRHLCETVQTLYFTLELLNALDRLQPGLEWADSLVAQKIYARVRQILEYRSLMKGEYPDDDHLLNALVRLRETAGPGAVWRWLANLFNARLAGDLASEMARTAEGPVLKHAFVSAGATFAVTWITTMLLLNHVEPETQRFLALALFGVPGVGGLAGFALSSLNQPRRLESEYNRVQTFVSRCETEFVGTSR